MALHHKIINIVLALLFTASTFAQIGTGFLREGDTASGGGSFSPNAVTFDGTNDYMTRSAAFTSSTDGGQGILSVWLNFGGEDASEQFLIRFGGQAFEITRTAADKIKILARNGGGTEIINVTSAASITSASGWTHILASWNTATPTFQLYVNSVSDSATVTTLTASSSVDWNVNAAHYFGANHIAESHLNACVSEFYLHTDTSLDLSVQSNREKFILAGDPVDLGSDGSTPTSSQPLIYLKGAFGAYTVNSGKGGNFDSLTGTLTTCTAP